MLYQTLKSVGRMETAEGFMAIIESCQQLLDAGYPGCARRSEGLSFKKVDGMKLNSETRKLSHKINHKISLDTIVSRTKCPDERAHSAAGGRMTMAVVVVAEKQVLQKTSLRL